MSVGGYISGAAHAGLIGWLLVGWGLGARPLEFQVTEVSLVSGAAFDEALRAGTPEAPAVEASLSPDLQSDAPAAPGAPAEEPRPAPPAPRPAPPAPRPATPAPSVAPAPEATPVPAEQTPPPPVDLSPEAPIVPETPPAPAPNTDVGTGERPKPRPVERLAPVPAEAPRPEAEIADTVREAVTPTPAPDAPAAVTPAPAAAPEEAATEVVTEAETPSAAPEISLRPRARPVRPAPAPAEAPEDEPGAPAVAEAPAPESPASPEAPAPADSATDDAVAAALAAASSGADAGAGAPAPASAGSPAGTSLTASETGAFLGQIGQCWNIEAVSTDAQNVTVTLSFRLTPQGRVEGGSIRREGYTGGTEGAAETAYRAAEQALIACQSRGRDGYDLPPEKYELWQVLKIRFNPETMRLR